LGVKLVV